MNFERERIRECVARLFETEACAEEAIADMERFLPAVGYYVKRKAADLIATGLGTSEKFLRSMPEALFDHLFDCALAFFERHGRSLEAPEKQAPEICALAILLYFDERGLAGHCGTDEELYAVMGGLANLIILEEEERAGVGAWVAYYESLERTLRRLSLRYPAPQWLTPN